MVYPNRTLSNTYFSRENDDPSNFGVRDQLLKSYRVSEPMRSNEYLRSIHANLVHHVSS